MRRANVPLLSLLSVLGAMLAGGCGGASHSGRELTLYNGQHEQTTALLVAAFEKQTGVKVNVRSGDEATLGNQILQEGSSSPADVFYTENTPVLAAPPRRGLPPTRRPGAPGGGPEPLRLCPGRLGGRLSPGLDARLQHQAAHGRPTAQLDPRARRAELEGQGRLRPVGDRLPAAAQRDRQARRDGDRRTLARGDAGQRPDLPGQRDGRHPGKQRRERRRADQPLLLVSAAR